MTVAILGASYLRTTSALMRRQSQTAEELRAFYAAEAGLAESFQGVRMGRTGQVGSENAPALLGDGLVWVDAVELESGSVRLNSTGLVGRGRAALSLLVEPVDISLGFFASDDVVFEEIVLVDGWNSSEGAYGGPPTKEPQESSTITIEPGMSFQDHQGYQILRANNTYYDYSSRVGDTFHYGNTVSRDLGTVERARAYFDALTPDTEPSLGEDLAGESSFGEDLAGQSGVSGSPAQVGSNGSIHFQLPPDETAEVHGDLRPGPGGQVTGLGNVEHNGEISSRSELIELPPVEVPSVSREPAHRHDGLLPLYISPGTTGYERLEVAPDADLVIRGPATVVIGELILEPGSSLMLDTRDGDVALYVTEGADFQLGSAITTTSDEPSETTLQVSASAVSPDDPTVNLEGSGQFYGTIYAPETDVYVGREFEIFGGIVAKRFSVGQGARLHADSAEYADSPLPEILGWRTIEVPPAAKGSGNPFQLMGTPRATATPLSNAHSLADVQLDVTFLDHFGSTRHYSGTEDAFDWSVVESIVSAERDPNREREVSEPGEPQDTEEADPLEEAEATPTARPAVRAALMFLTGVALRDALLAIPNLNGADVDAIVAANRMGSPLLEGILLAHTLEPGLQRRLINGDSTLTSAGLRGLLLSNSPLPPEIVTHLNSSPGILTPGDLSQVLLSQ